MSPRPYSKGDDTRADRLPKKKKYMLLNTLSQGHTQQNPIAHVGI